VEARYTLADLLADMRSADIGFVEKMLVPVTDGFRIFPAPPMEHEPLRASPEDIVHALDLVKQLADVVILDLPLHNDVRFEAYSVVNHALLMTEQTVPSLRALGNARRILDPIEGVQQTLVINRFNPRMEGFSLDQMQQVLKTNNLATIANDYAAVSRSINEGRPLRLLSPGSRVVTDINNLAKMQVVPGYEPQLPGRKTNGLSWFLKAFANGKKEATM
jgi:Flp pilus assembly CpaE family ATPase